MSVTDITSIARPTIKTQTIIIGAGQAGLSVSYYLSQHDQPHILLERSSIGNSWRNERWDSFTLVTPNWMNKLPNCEYAGGNPDGFLTGAEVVTYLEDFAASFQAPTTFGIKVEQLTRQNDGRFYLRTNKNDYHADQVVVAAL